MNIPREPLHCEVCGAELAGGLDTYGEPGYERCQVCFLHPPEADYPRGNLRMAVSADRTQIISYFVQSEDDDDDWPDEDDWDDEDDDFFDDDEDDW